jgi:hypothetical protein
MQQVYCVPGYMYAEDLRYIYTSTVCCTGFYQKDRTVRASVPEPDPVPCGCEPPGSGSVIYLYGFGSGSGFGFGSGSFHQQAKQ